MATCVPRRAAWLAVIGALWMLTGTGIAGEASSKSNDRLKRLLERFPRADLNGDGVLTASEARRAWQQRQQQGGAGKQKPARGPKPTAENVSYGAHERNVLDFWKAESETPSPVVVFIHGGGFRGGDKAKCRGSKLIPWCLEAGVSFAALNYRFRKHAPVQDIVRDCARAIQFLRTKAAEWNIDPKRIASYGGSAGAGTSLWLAFHDDLADPESQDPVLRQSSRLACAGSLNGQATYDLRRWEKVLGPPPGGMARSDAELLGFYGFKDKAEMETPEGDKIMKDMDMLGLLTDDDPPVFLSSGQPNTEPKNRGHYVHHPRHSIAVHTRCQELKIESEIVLREDLAKGGGSTDERLKRFLFKHLGVKG